MINRQHFLCEPVSISCLQFSTSGARRSTRVTRARHSMLDSDWDDARGVSYLEDEDNPKYDTVA